MQHGLTGAIAEDHVAKFYSAVGHLQLQRLRRVFLEIALVEKVVKQADAEHR